ncbi:MAG: CooT family nickel-binding protein [Lachnospiraceae bacterium]|nr:CooT family nickel-binding protein [Lachnospiraceae bacterium]
MCLANAYDEVSQALLMENTKTIDVDGDTVILTDLFGGVKRVKGEIAHIDLEENRVIVKVA